MYPFRKKAVIGVVHLKALPGSPAYGGDLGPIRRAALADAEALCKGGVDGLILENYGDAPFLPGPVEPHTAAIMAVILSEIAATTDLPLGVNVLRNDGASGLGIALASGARFIRVNVFTGAAVTDQGILQGEAHRLLRYRERLGLDAAILADVHVKHGRPLAGGPIDEAARDAYLRGRADGVIITGPATGAALDLEELRAVRRALPDAPILAGSGVTGENVKAILEPADGAIVGTAFKKGGVTDAPVDPDRVAAFMDRVRSGS